MPSSTTVDTSDTSVSECDSNESTTSFQVRHIWGGNHGLGKCSFYKTVSVRPYAVHCKAPVPCLRLLSYPAVITVWVCIAFAEMKTCGVWRNDWWMTECITGRTAFYGSRNIAYTTPQKFDSDRWRVLAVIMTGENTIKFPSAG